MPSNAQKRTVILCYIRFKRCVRCVLMRLEEGSRAQSQLITRAQEPITRDGLLACDCFHQQIENGKIANQIHGFTIDFGKFIYRVCAPDVIKFSNPKQKSH